MVISLRNLWHFGKLVAEESCLITRGGRNRKFRLKVNKILNFVFALSYKIADFYLASLGQESIQTLLFSGRETVYLTVYMYCKTPRHCKASFL